MLYCYCSCRSMNVTNIHLGISYCCMYIIITNIYLLIKYAIILDCNTCLVHCYYHFSLTKEIADLQLCGWGLAVNRQYIWIKECMTWTLFNWKATQYNYKLINALWQWFNNTNVHYISIDVKCSLLSNACKTRTDLHLFN